MIISASGTGTQSTNSGSWAAMPSLSITLPGVVCESVFLILNVPCPYATGNDFPGGNFANAINGTVQAPYASFTYNEQQPQSTGRIPTTLTVVAPLNSATGATVQAMWSGVRGSTVHIDSPATLTAIVA
jgi:hypothetical protein